MKTVLLLVTVLASTFGAQAQGTIYFVNNNGTRISTNSVMNGPATGLTAPAANQFYYALFYSTTATSVLGTAGPIVPVNGTFVSVLDDPKWTFALYGTNMLASGRFASSSGVNSDGSSSVPGLAGGTSADFVVLGWSANLGSNVFNIEQNIINNNYLGDDVWVGESAVSGAITVGQLGSTPPAVLFAPGLGNIPGFMLGDIAFIPEPSAQALTGVGLAGLFFFRHRPPV